MKISAEELHRGDLRALRRFLERGPADAGLLPGPSTPARALRARTLADPPAWKRREKGKTRSRANLGSRMQHQTPGTESRKLASSLASRVKWGN